MPLSYGQHDEDTDAARATAEANVQLNTSNYVEARALLVPATDFFRRAAEVAERQDGVTGDILVSVSLFGPS